jgi:hypothetical protein
MVEELETRKDLNYGVFFCWGGWVVWFAGRGRGQMIDCKLIMIIKNWMGLGLVPVT